MSGDDAYMDEADLVIPENPDQDNNVNDDANEDITPEELLVGMDRRDEVAEILVERYQY
jgi:hypothetical protein